MKDPELVAEDTDDDRESKYRYKKPAQKKISIAMRKRIAGKPHGPFVRADGGRLTPTSSDSTAKNWSNVQGAKGPYC